MTDLTPDAAAKLREPFPDSMIGKLPKGNTTLDFVGHAAVTDRLLKVDPFWTWEPLALADDGGPLVRVNGKEAEMWIRLTVCGVTRIAVGTATASSFELSKQLISDALRNGAMRFGVALDLWAKQDLSDASPPIRVQTDQQAQVINDRTKTLTEDQKSVLNKWWKAEGFGRKEQLTLEEAARVLEKIHEIDPQAGDEEF